MPVSLFISASPLSFAIVFFSLAMFAHQFWSANIQTLPAALFAAKNVGAVEGPLGSAGSFGGMVFGLLVGRRSAPGELRQVHRIDVNGQKNVFGQND